MYQFVMAEAFNLALGPLPDAPPAAQLRFSAELVRMLRAAGDALLASVRAVNSPAELKRPSNRSV